MTTASRGARRRAVLKGLLFIPPVTLGLIGLQLLRAGPPEAVPAPERSAVAVRAVTLRSEVRVPVATGHGRVTAARRWSAVPEVAGRLSFVADNLAEGRIVRAGETLFVIDAESYEIARDKAAANLAAAHADLSELDQQERNTRSLTALEQRGLVLKRAEYERTQALVKRGTTAASTLDTAEQSLLAQEEALQSLRNTLALFDDQRARSEATIAFRKAELADAERALRETRLQAPFDGRVTEAEADAREYVRAGDVLATIEGTEASEVMAEFHPSALDQVLRATRDRSIVLGNSLDATDAITLLQSGQMRAVVRQSGATRADGSWPAEIVRVRGSVDKEIGTVGIIVRVDHPNLVIPGKRAPLNNNSFVEVDIAPTEVAPRLFVPQEALRRDDRGETFVYVADADDRLAKMPVRPGFVAEDRLALDGAREGTRVVLSDPDPPILGRPLVVVEDRMIEQPPRTAASE